jgi:hypothetical protein
MASGQYLDRTGDGLFLVTGSTALAQQKNALDGYDEGFIEFFRMAQDGLKDKNDAEPAGRLYKVDQRTCDKIQDGMTEARVREIIGGPPHADSGGI